MSALRSLFILLLTFTLSGCGGDVDWFPGRQPTTPNAFSFPAKTGVAENTAVESDPVTVAGIAADTQSPISVSGSVGSNSTYSINGGTPTSTPGTVQNGDVVKVQHTSATALGTNAVTTLTIGGISANFTSTTVTVVLPTFSDRTGSNAVAAGTVVETSATLSSSDLAPHQISIANGAYSLDNVNNFTTASQSVSFLNNRTIFLRTTASTTSGQSVKVTLTIDGATTTWTVTTR